MRRRRVLVMVASAAAVWGAGLLAVPGAEGAWAVPAAAGAGPAASLRGRAIEVPGLAALNADRYAQLFQVSCGSAGNCAAGGFYRDRHGHGQGFVVSERNGRWGRAIEVPGLAALRTGEQAWVLSVSCGSAGSCAAGGFYGDRDDHRQGFVAVEKNGVWGKAIEVPGLGTLNKGMAEVFSVSCASAGSCAAGGEYGDLDNHEQGFVVGEKNGVWGQAIAVPGLGALSAGGFARVSSVSCGSAGSCAAGGDYQAGAFVVSEKNGVWGHARDVPAPAGRSAGISSVSCASAGNCAAGGEYFDNTAEQGLLVSEKNGVWGKAIKVPGLAALAKGGFAQVGPVSCASAGNCAAGGFYGDLDNHRHGFVVSEKNGVWHHAIDVPGLGALNTGRYAEVNSVSCASAGNCAAGGDYRDQHQDQQGFMVSEKNGVWGHAIAVPGLAALNKGGDASLSSVSCASPGRCAAGGSYAERSRHPHLQGFVTQATASR